MEQTEITREQAITQLKEAIEYQELQTKLQELITKQVLEKYNEIKITKMFQDEFGKPQGSPAPSDIEEMKKEAEAAMASQETTA